MFLFVNKTKFLQVKDLYPSEHIELNYFWNKKTDTLEMSSFLNTVKANPSNFQQIR